jgi:menaquinone-9 beta-reductase
MSAGKLWEVAIIGAGPAGTAAACHLAQAGREVLLLEKQPRAHHKVCGEFLSVEAQRDLRELGVDPLRLGAAKINFIRLFNGGRAVRARLPFQALGLSRFVLDEQLLARAAACGATIRRGCKVTGLKRTRAHWRLDVNAWGSSVQARAVFLASGKHELRDQKRRPGRQNDLVGFKMHFRAPDSARRILANHVDIILFDGGYAGLQLVERGTANLCLLIQQHRFAELHRDWNALIHHLARSAPQLRNFWTQAAPRWERPLAIASLPYGYVHAEDDESTPELYRLGDQFAVTPSFSGDGVSIALHTGKLAALSFLRAGARAAPFHSQARDDIWPQIKAALRLAGTMNHPVARRAGFAACRAYPPLITRMVRRTRLPSVVAGEDAANDARGT